MSLAGLIPILEMDVPSSAKHVLGEQRWLVVWPCDYQAKIKSSYLVNILQRAAHNYATFPLNTMMVSHRRCTASSDGWIWVM